MVRVIERESSMDNVYKFKRNLELRFVTPLTGNTLGVKANFKWKKFSRSCQRNWKLVSSSEAKSIAREIKRDGLAVVSKVSVESLLKEATQYFGHDHKLIQHMEQSYQARLAPELYRVLTQVKAPIEEYFGSHFRPYWISVQKTMPGKVDVSTSFGWHIDDNPREMIKLFVYLNDVKESNGAFRAFPWKTTKKLIAKGFRSFDAETRTRNHDWIDSFLNGHHDELKVLEGESGTVLAFDNNLVHKGTAPLEGFRIAIQIPVIPAREPFSLADIERALLSKRKRDFPAVPGSDDFGD
jgi:hypothetical protein